MTDRVISYSIIARVNSFIAGMEQVRLSTAKSVDAAVASKKSLDELGQSLTRVGTVAVGAGAIAAAALVIVTKAAADYGAKMAQLQSLSHASAQQMRELSDAAMTQGQDFGYSASQVADAEIELTKAGLSASQILGGALKGALAIAADGQMDVGSATEIATVAMTQFGLKASDIPHLADLLAAGADKALGSVADLGDALKNGGLQAHNMGLTVDDTIGTLAAFANQGIIGAEAGTQLRSMFIQLQRETPQAKAVLDQYGISIYDASGKFVGITKLAGELHDKLGDLSQAQRNAALATVFGSHAIVGATALYQYGAAGIGKWIAAVNDSGFADAQAAGKLNSLQGDVQKLVAAFQTDLIKAGTGANDVLRGLVQTGTRFLGFLGSVPAPVANVTTGLLAATAAVGLFGGGALIAVPKIVEFNAALDELGLSLKGVAATAGAVGAVVFAVGDLGNALLTYTQKTAATAPQIKQSALDMASGWEGLNTAFKHVGNTLDAGSGFRKAIDYLGNGGASSAGSADKFVDSLTLGITHLGDVVKTNEGQLDALGQQLAGFSKQNYAAAASSFNDLTTKYKLNGDEIRNLVVTDMPAYRDQLIQLLHAAGLAATQQNILAAAQDKGAVGARVAAAAAREQTSSVTQQAAALHGDTTAMTGLLKAEQALAKQNEDLESTEDAALDAIQAVTAAVKQNGSSLDQNTAKGRANREAVVAATQAIEQHAASINSDGKHADEASTYTLKAAAALEEQATKAGLSKASVDRLVASLLGLPKDTSVKVLLNDAAAAAKLASIRRAMNNLDGTAATVYVNAVANGVSSGQAAQQAKNAAQHGGLAAGGQVTGSGAKGVDSVPAVLAPGEHVLTARDVDAMGGQRNVYLFRSRLHMADGGSVDTPNFLSSPVGLGARSASPQVFVRGTASSAGRSGGSSNVPIVRMPDTITVRDAHGFELRMAVIADHRIALDAGQDAVLEYGRGA